MKDKQATGTESVDLKIDTKEKNPKKRREGGAALLLTQSVIVAAIVLVALVFRLIGGNVFSQLRTQLEAALADNAFTETALSLWISKEAEQEASPQSKVQENYTAAGAIPAASVRYLRFGREL